MLDISIGDLILVDGTGIISKAIEAVEYGPIRDKPREYSHTAGYVGDNNLIEAEGFRATGYAPLDKYTGHADVFHCPKASKYQRKDIHKLAKWYIGSRYDYLLLPVEFLRYLTGLVLPYHEPARARICSVLWAGIYREVGIDLCPGIRWPTPRDISESKLLVNIGSI